MRKIKIFTLWACCILSVTFTNCQKETATHSGGNNKAPRTNPMPSEVTSDWSMTSSGGGYVYDHVTYGNSGKGVEVMMKQDGTGWWNEIEKVATPGCVLSTNISMDCNFEMHNENGRSRIYVYITGGEYHGVSCSSKTDKVLTGQYAYPQYPPMKYDYKIVSADNSPSQKLLLLSQEEDDAKRFRANADKTLLVLKKQ